MLTTNTICHYSCECCDHIHPVHFVLVQVRNVLSSSIPVYSLRTSLIYLPKRPMQQIGKKKKTKQNKNKTKEKRTN